MISVFICEDNREFRENLEKFLPRMGDIRITGSTDTAETALENEELYNSNVLILDLEMPGRGGLWAISELAKVENKPEILVLTSFTSEETVFQALRDGASGYLVKGAGIKKILEAINDVSTGGTVIEPILATRFWNYFVSCSVTTKTDDSDLSETELEILTLVGKGLSNPEVGSALGKSRTNIKKVLARIYKKLGVNTRVEAVTCGLKRGLITL